MTSDQQDIPPVLPTATDMPRGVYLLQIGHCLKRDAAAGTGHVWWTWRGPVSGPLDAIPRMRCCGLDARGNGPGGRWTVAGDASYGEVPFVLLRLEHDDGCEWLRDVLAAGIADGTVPALLAKLEAAS